MKTELYDEAARLQKIIKECESALYEGRATPDLIPTTKLVDFSHETRLEIAKFLKTRAEEYEKLFADL